MRSTRDIRTTRNGWWIEVCSTSLQIGLADHRPRLDGTSQPRAWQAIDLGCGDFGARPREHQVVAREQGPGLQVAGGDHTFSDGVNSPWYLDQFGRLGLTPKDEAYKPSDEDLAEFQKQLQAELQKSGM